MQTPTERANTLDYVKDQMGKGLMTVEQANVYVARAGRVVLVTTRLPAAIRAAYGNAVKSGTLCHVKKDGNKPEAYYHPDFKYLVAGERNKHADATAAALRAIMA
jgi:hypothetical protein